MNYPEKDSDEERGRVLSRYEPFVAAARRFVTLIEQDNDDKSPKAFLLELIGRMLEVAKHGLLLDYAYIDRDDFDAKPYDNHGQEYANCKEHIEQLLALMIQGAKVEYMDYEPDIVRIHMFSGDISDLYSDLAFGLRLWDLGSIDSRGEACWQWAFSKSHWHDHLYGALLGANLMRFAGDPSGMAESTK